MKWLYHYLLTLLLSLSPFSAAAQFHTPSSVEGVVSVSGSAAFEVVPDEVIVFFGVETRSEQLDAARLDNNARIQRTIEFLKSAGIDPSDYQTDYVGVNPNYDYNGAHVEPTRYTVQRSIEVRLKRVGDFEKILTGALKSGINTVHGIEFRTSQLRKYRDEARKAAIIAAREKAELLTGAVGLRLGAVTNIHENTWGGSWRLSSSWRRGGDNFIALQNRVFSAGENSEANGATFALGKISISSTVNLSFKTEPVAEGAAPGGSQ